MSHPLQTTPLHSNVISGFGGSMALQDQTISTIANWNITRNLSSIERYASNTGRFSVQLPGIESFQGSYTRYAMVPFERLGRKYRFTGYAGHTAYNVDEDAIRGIQYEGQVLITGVNITYNWETRDTAVYTVDFLSTWDKEGDQLRVNPSVGHPDIVKRFDTGELTFRQPNRKGMRVKPVGAANTDWKNLYVKNCTLNFSINPIIENHSGSGRYQHVLEGGNVSLHMNSTVASSNFEDVAGMADNLDVQIFPDVINNNAFWDIRSFTNVSLSNLNTDIEGGSAVNFTLQGQYNLYSFPDIPDNIRALGWIKDPLNRFWVGAQNYARENS